MLSELETPAWPDCVQKGVGWYNSGCLPSMVKYFPCLFFAKYSLCPKYKGQTILGLNKESDKRLTCPSIISYLGVKLFNFLARHNLKRHACMSLFQLPVTWFILGKMMFKMHSWMGFNRQACIGGVEKYGIPCNLGLISNLWYLIFEDGVDALHHIF